MSTASQNKYTVEPAPEAERSRACPVCLRRLIPDSPQCFNCGFDPRIGLASCRMVRKKNVDGEMKPICASCGYDLSAVPAMKCPECGTPVRLKSKRDHLLEDAASVRRWAYLTPIIIIAVGLIGSCVIRAIGGFAVNIPGYVALTAINIVVGMLAYVLLSLILIDADAPWHMTLLRMTAVYTGVGLISDLIAQIGSPLLLLFGVIVAHLFMLKRLLDLELEDAVILGFVTIGLRIGLFFLLARAIGAI